MALKLITPPESEPITLTEAKKHLKIEVEDTVEDDNINSLIRAAREYCEDYQCRAYVSQVWELVLDQFPIKNFINIPIPPLQSVESVKYKDKNGVECVFDLNNYIVDIDKEPGRIFLAYGKSWPSVTLQPVSSFRIRFTAGYSPKSEGDSIDLAGNVPETVKQAMKLLIGYWFENREAAIVGSVGKELEFSVHALLNPNRIIVL